MRILVVEDDVSLCEAMRFHLEREGYEVELCHDGDAALDLMMQSAYALVILDRMLPGLGGLDLLGQIRRGRVATRVMMVTALGAVEDRVAGLDAGADDYLSKPFAVPELLARVRSLIRRAPLLESDEESVGDLRLDTARRQLKGPLAVCPLSKREAQLFEVFVRNPNQILPRELLFARVWGPQAPVEDGNLDSYIHFLRQRLRGVGSRCKIRTLHGVGYRLDAQGDAPC